MPDRALPGQSDHSDCPFFLSPRQTEVLRLAAQGLTDLAVGRCLGISPRTVRNHLVQIRERLNAANTTHAVAIAAAWGLLKLDFFLQVTGIGDPMPKKA